MNRIDISITELETLKSGKPLGRGTCAEVYETNDNKAVKIIFEDAMHTYSEKEIANINSLTEISSDCFMFPRILIYCNNQFVGYFMNLCNGISFYDFYKNIPINILCNTIEQFYEEIKDVSNKGILLADFNCGSMLVTKDGQIKVVDTDFYVKASSYNIDEYYKKNIEEVNSQLQVELGLLSGQGRLIDNLINEEKLNNFYKRYFLSSMFGKEIIPIQDLIMMVKTTAENKYHQIFTTFSDMESYIEKQSGKTL